MATTGLALHPRPAHCTPRRRVARHANPHLARQTAQISRATSRVARHSWRRAFNRNQGRGKRSHRLRKISPRVLSRAAHAVLARGTRAWPPLPRVCLAQACSNGRSRRDRGNPRNDALHAPCGNDSCMCDAAPARCKSGTGYRLSYTLPSSRSDPRADLPHGTLDMLIRRTLHWGPQHGHAIAQTIRAQRPGCCR